MRGQFNNIKCCGHQPWFCHRHHGNMTIQLVNKFKYLQSKLDPCLYTIREHGSVTGIMGVHVDETALDGIGEKYGFPFNKVGHFRFFTLGSPASLNWQWFNYQPNFVSVSWHIRPSLLFVALGILGMGCHDTITKRGFLQMVSQRIITSHGHESCQPAWIGATGKSRMPFQVVNL